MKEKIKVIGGYFVVIAIIVFLISIVFFHGIGETHHMGMGLSGIVDNVTLLPDQGKRFDVYLVNFTDRQPWLMFLPLGYNITSGFKHWFRGEFQGDFYQAHTVMGTFREKIFNCMAVYDNPGPHKALWVTRGITTIYSDHYIFPEDSS